MSSTVMMCLSTPGGIGSIVLRIFGMHYNINVKELQEKTRACISYLGLADIVVVVLGTFAASFAIITKYVLNHSSIIF